jgi:hypothetical protein
VEQLEARELLAAYYVAPAGVDSNAGTIESPFATLQKAHDVVAAGDTIFMRGGVFNVSDTQNLSPRRRATEPSWPRPGRRVVACKPTMNFSETIIVIHSL